MTLFGRGKGKNTGSAGSESKEPKEPRSAPVAGVDTDTVGSGGARVGRTAPKGRPTPKRDAARQRSPTVRAPMTSAEARARRKALAGPKLSRQERRAEKARRRERVAERRERMLAGDEAYLLERDRGPVRKFARDVVDARRNVLGLFMPAALTLLFVMMTAPQLQYYMSPAMLLFMVAMAADSVILGRKVVRLVDARFPENTEGRLRLGLYAASRASQPRRLRAPRPQVERGAKVD